MREGDSYSSDSNDSSTLSSSSELTEEEDDSTGSSSSSTGPLFEFSSLMEQLPIKRGLSKYYEGKSQSFTSLSNVRCLEDLPKKEIACYNKKKMKPSKSYGGLELGQKQLNYSLGPCSKAYINKKSSLSLIRRSSGNLLSFSKPPPHPPPPHHHHHHVSSLHKNL